MKALPSIYAGTAFRSRLEADWAKTLDARGLPWEYEPEGFELSDGTCYSPDFWLPTAKAWFEVKGDHMLGLSKVEQFAAELWAESKADGPDDRRSPMVLLGVEPWRDFCGLPEWSHVLGVRGIGKRFSAAMVKCPECRMGTFIALWQNWCRACGATFEDGREAWSPAVFRSYELPFMRNPRPAGKGRR